MLRVPTDKKGEFVAFKWLQPTTAHVDFLEKLFRLCAADDILRNLPLACLYKQGPNDPGKEGHIALYRIVLDRGMIRHLNPEGW